MFICGLFRSKNFNSDVRQFPLFFEPGFKLGVSPLSGQTCFDLLFDLVKIRLSCRSPAVEFNYEIAGGRLYEIIFANLEPGNGCGYSRNWQLIDGDVSLINGDVTSPFLFAGIC